MVLLTDPWFPVVTLLLPAWSLVAYCVFKDRQHRERERRRWKGEK